MTLIENKNDHDFWQLHIAQWQVSRAPHASYCRQQALRTHQFGYWKRKFCKRLSLQLYLQHLMIFWSGVGMACAARWQIEMLFACERAWVQSWRYHVTNRLRIKRFLVVAVYRNLNDFTPCLMVLNSDYASSSSSDTSLYYCFTVSCPPSFSERTK